MPPVPLQYESYSKQISHLKVDRGKDIKKRSWETEADSDEDEAQMVRQLRVIRASSES